MRVRYTETALADIDSIFFYVHERNPTAAARIVESVEATAARLATHPQSARKTDEPGVRMTPIARFPVFDLLRDR